MTSLSDEAVEEIHSPLEAVPRATTFDELAEAVAELRARVSKIESRKSPGRKGRNIVSSEVGVCGLDPECDSAECEQGTVYRYQQGCRGLTCVQANSDYYKQYRAEHRKPNLGLVVTEEDTLDEEWEGS